MVCGTSEKVVLGKEHTYLQRGAVLHCIPILTLLMFYRCHCFHTGGIVDGVVSGAVLGLVWRGAVVLADKAGLKKEIEKARDKLRK